MTRGDHDVRSVPFGIESGANSNFIEGCALCDCARANGCWAGAHGVVELRTGSRDGTVSVEPVHNIGDSAKPVWAATLGGAVAPAGRCTAIAQLPSEVPHRATALLRT